MKFAAFKSSKGRPVWVNMDRVEAIEASGDSETVLHMASGEFRVVKGAASLVVREIETRSKSDADATS